MFKMILTKNVLIKLNNKNIKIIKNNGYNLPLKYNDEILIDIKYLSNSSHYEILVKCDNCGCEKYLPYQAYNKGTNNNTEKYYCNNKECINIKRNISVKNKYGVDNVFQINEIKDKIKNTNLLLYGVENPQQNKEIKEKTEQTNIKLYGFKNVFQNEKIKEQIKNTNIKNLGTEYPSQNKKVVEKSINTMIEKYGEAFFHIIPRYNLNSLIIFDEIAEKFNINIQHALNGGEKKFIKYWVDGYIEKYNIVIEYDEFNHKYQKEKDIERQKFIEDNFGCKFIRIDETKYLTEKERIYNLIEELIY